MDDYARLNNPASPRLRLVHACGKLEWVPRDYDNEERKPRGGRQSQNGRRAGPKEANVNHRQPVDDLVAIIAYPDAVHEGHEKWKKKYWAPVKPEHRTAANNVMFRDANATNRRPGDPDPE